MLHQSDQSIDRPEGRSRRDLFPLTLSAALVLLVVLAGPCLVGYVYTHDDLGAFHLPLRSFYAEQLARGEPFDWMPQLYSGFYLTGEGQAGTYHPLHLVLYRFLPLETAWACELLASYPFMLAGTYLFLRRLLGRRDAAMFGSLVFTFSGFNLLHFVHPNAIAVVAHLPWLLWTIDVILIKPDRRRLVAAQAGIALLTGSQLLLGYPQYVWFSLLAEAAYALFVITGRRRVQKGHVINSCGRLAIAKVAGVMLGGVQLLPTADALSHSVRRSVDAAFLNSGSMHPLNLVQLIAPYLFTHRVVGQNTHELGLYLGTAPLMLIVWLLVRRRDLGPLGRPALGAAGFGLFALLLAFGQYGPVYRLQRFLPVVGSFRFPCRYVVLVSLSAAVVSAIGLAVLLRQQRRDEKTPWPRLWPLWMVVGASVLVAAVGLVLQGRPFIGPFLSILAGPLLIGSAAVLLALAARGVRWALAGLVLFAAADLGYYGMSYAGYPQTERLEAYVAGAATPQTSPAGRVLAHAARFDEPGLRTGNQMTLSGWHRADGYAGLEPARRLDYRRLPALRAAGVRWVKRGHSTEAIAGLLRHDEHWLEVPRPLERVRLVTQARPSRDPARDIERIPLHSTALVDGPLELPPGLPGTATTVAERPGRFHVRVDCPTRQLLVVSERYHPGWKAQVDGRPRHVLRANGDFLGCVVRPGQRDVVLEFRPQSLRTGLIVSCLGLTLVLGIAAGHLLERRRGESPSAHGDESARACPEEKTPDPILVAVEETVS